MASWDELTTELLDSARMDAVILAEAVRTGDREAAEAIIKAYEGETNDALPLVVELAVLAAGLLARHQPDPAAWVATVLARVREGTS
jgi:hypothetical protein